MTDETQDQLREKDRTVLTSIHEGHTDTRQVREATTLSNRDVNYALDKLENVGLIETETPDGRVTQVVDGQKRNFKAPRKAVITESGVGCLQALHVERSKFEDMSHRELVECVRELEREMGRMEDSLDAFRRQVLNKLD